MSSSGSDGLSSNIMWHAKPHKSLVIISFESENGIMIKDVDFRVSIKNKKIKGIQSKRLQSSKTA